MEFAIIELTDNATLNYFFSFLIWTLTISLEQFNFLSGLTGLLTGFFLSFIILKRV